MNSKTRNRLLAAVATAMPLAVLAVPASAQTRVNQEGRALDNNTRVGSDGSNDRNNSQDARGGTFVTGNQIVTGNVSGARAFRGPVGYRDPNEFSGPIAGRSSDRLVRDSAGAPTRTNPTVDYGRPTAFYGDARATAPPPGFRPESFTGGYFNTGASQQTTPGALNPALRNTNELWNQTAIRSGGVLLQSRDENNQPQTLSASPLYGVVPLNGDPSAGPAGAPGMQRADRFDPRNQAGRNRLSPAEIERMREELNERQGGDADGNANALDQRLDSSALDNTLAGTRGEGTQGARAATSAERNQVDLSPGAGGGNGQPGNRVDNRLSPDRLGGTDVQTQQGLRRELAIPPSKQSKVMAELQQRFNQQQAAGVGGAVGDQESNRQLRQMRAAQTANPPAENAEGQPGADAAPGGAGNERPRAVLPPVRRQPAAPAAGGARPAPAAAPAAKPAAKPAPAAPAEPRASAPAPAPAAKRPEPLRVKSLAEGVEAPGLRDLLRGAEDLMRQGKFRSATEKYAQAEQVTPNNPLIRLGSAHAALADQRYTTAERNLREAIQADPALLMGQYDLESFIGRDRLAFVVKDLQQVAESEPASPRPRLLLAYIAYGSPGLEAAAADHLAAAAQRTGQPDPLIEAMRKHWSLPAPEGGTTPELNK